MSNPDSTQTVNKRVAKALGYKLSHIKWADDSSMDLYWRPTPRQGEPPVPLPDFCGTWEHAGPLWVEMIKWAAFRGGATQPYFYRTDNYGFGITLGNFTFEGSTLPEAITRAYDAWKQGEEG